MDQTGGGGEFAEPTEGFVQVFETEFECAVVHGDEPLGLKFLEDRQGFVWAHMHAAKGIRVVGTDGQEGDFGAGARADFFEAWIVGAVSGVVDGSALVFDKVAAKASVVVVEDARAPML